MFELMDSYSQSSAVIRVIGVGGGGGNAVEHMLANSVEGVEFVCANTDAQALRASSAHVKLQLGNDVTKGLGAGADPEVGRQSALEDRDRIQEALEGADALDDRKVAVAPEVAQGEAEAIPAPLEPPSDLHALDVVPRILGAYDTRETASGRAVSEQPECVDRASLLSISMPVSPCF